MYSKVFRLRGIKCAAISRESFVESRDSCLPFLGVLRIYFAPLRIAVGYLVVHWSDTLKSNQVLRCVFGKYF